MINAVHPAAQQNSKFAYHCKSRLLKLRPLLLFLLLKPTFRFFKTTMETAPGIAANRD
jgi:hypothetical protein